MAKTYANKPFIEKKVQKNLWLKIAKHLLRKSDDDDIYGKGRARIDKSKNQENVDVSKALALLHETSELKIDDLLPLFPDDAKIENLKDDLCKCLEDYNKKINNLKEEL
jgi:hypothetical protein